MHLRNFVYSMNKLGIALAVIGPSRSPISTEAAYLRPNLFSPRDAALSEETGLHARHTSRNAFFRQVTRGLQAGLYSVNLGSNPSPPANAYAAKIKGLANIDAPRPTLVYNIAWYHRKDWQKGGNLLWKETIMIDRRATRRTRRDFLFAAVQVALFALISRPAQAAVAPLKIATIGAGNVGSALGKVWVKAGHRVMFSSRHPEELNAWVEGLGPSARAGTVAEAVAFADVVLLAVPYGALRQIGKDFATALAGKALVLDTCNPFPNRDGEVAVMALEKGAGLYTAELLPGAPIVRAFNAVGARRMEKGGRRADGTLIGIPMAGDNSNALAVASDLVRDAEFEPVIVGSLEFGKHLRPGTPLAGEHTPDEIRKIAATLN